MEVNYKQRMDLSPKVIYDPKLISLIAGSPGPELLYSCCEIMDTATKHRMKIQQSKNATLFQYGPTTGRQDFRDELSKFLTKHYETPVHCDDIVLTTGATYGLHLILTTLVDLSEGVVFVDEITYMMALRIIEQFPALKVIPITLHEDGVDVGDLERKVIGHKFQTKSKKLFWGIYYTMTVFHNPTGIRFSDDVCKQLISLSRKHDFLIVTDDVYNMLSYRDDYLPKRLYAYDDINDSDYKGNVISNGSFSKIIAPGLRIGWLESPPRCIKSFLSCGVLSAGATNNYTSGVMISLIQLGLADQQYQQNLTNYKERMLLGCKLLNQNLPKSCSFNEPMGGYFIWVQIPHSVDAAAFNKYATEKHSVCALHGTIFSPNQLSKNYLRISIAFHTVDNLEIGIKRLCLALTEYNNELGL